MTEQFFGCSTVADAPGDDPLGVHEIAALLKKPQGVLRPSDSSFASRSVATFRPVEVSADLKPRPDRLNLLPVRQPKYGPVLKVVICQRRESREVGLEGGGTDSYQTEAAKRLIDSFVRWMTVRCHGLAISHSGVDENLAEQGASERRGDLAQPEPEPAQVGGAFEVSVADLSPSAAIVTHWVYSITPRA
jgi:hypothetical protein